MKIIENGYDYVKWEEDDDQHITMKMPRLWGNEEQAWESFTAVRMQIKNPRKTYRNLNIKLKKR